MNPTEFQEKIIELLGEAYALRKLPIVKAGQPKAISDVKDLQGRMYKVLKVEPVRPTHPAECKYWKDWLYQNMLIQLKHKNIEPCVISTANAIVGLLESLLPDKEAEARAIQQGKENFTVMLKNAGF